MLTTNPKRACTLAALACLSWGLSGCYVVNFFKGHQGGGNGGGAEAVEGVIGQSLGKRAGGSNDALLASVYGTATTHAPAAIRPDPDLYVRRLLRQYRPEGVTIARQIGQVEQFRLLLGGASEDFAKTPQDSYDATSLLAVFKVAQDVCRGLVAPNAWEHPGWSTILPYGPDDENANMLWLAQRMLGKPSTAVDPAIFPSLTTIMHSEEASLEDDPNTKGNPFAKYIPVCATLALDAEAMYL